MLSLRSIGPPVGGVLVVLALLMFSDYGDQRVRAAEDLNLEELPSDPTQKKIVLIAGTRNAKPGEHEYVAGCVLMRRLLRQSSGIFPVISQGWPQHPETLRGAASIVLFLTGGGEQPSIEHRAEMQQFVDAGVGMVHLHNVIDYPVEMGEQVRGWLGGCYEPKFSQRAHWVTTHQNFPEHPVTRGVQPFTIDDGYLYKLRFLSEKPGITPVLHTLPPDKQLAGKAPDDEALVCWCFDRPTHEGRSFVFTGGHLHRSWGEAGFRQLLINGILWTAHVDLPAHGAPVVLEPTDLQLPAETAR